MAPGLVEPLPERLSVTVNQAPVQSLKNEFREHIAEQKNTTERHISYEPGRGPVASYDDYEHEWARPSFPDIKREPLTEVPYSDKGLLGDPTFTNLLSEATDIFDHTPKIGTEVRGIDIANLTDLQKNDLARLIAVRGVVLFRNQKNLDIDKQRELSRYFGHLHSHATTAVPSREGYEDVHVVYSGENGKDQRSSFAPAYLWHSDVTYEIQPPSYTSLKLLTGPPQGGGGDTLWSSQYALYDVLSKPMQQYLEGLKALHSAERQAQDSVRAGRSVRREPVVTAHPLVRVNPVTGWKSLFFNPGFITAIVGVPKLESDYIIRYLTEIVGTVQEAHARFQLRKDDVAFWDNRVCNHTASYGFAPHRRHAVRVAVRAEKPFYDPSGKSQEEELAERYDLPRVNKDGSGDANYND